MRIVPVILSSACVGVFALLALAQPVQVAPEKKLGVLRDAEGAPQTAQADNASDATEKSDPESVAADQPTKSAASQPTSRPALSADQQARITELVQQLGNRSAAVRKQAEADLVALGPLALPMLRAARDAETGAERLARLESAIAQIVDAEETGPSRITVDFKDAPLETIVAAINQQAGSALLAPDNNFGGAAKQRFSLKLNNATFWETMDALEKNGGWSFSPDNLWRAMPAQFGNNVSGPGFDHGAFRFVAQQSSVSVSIGYARNFGSNSNFSFSFMVRAEPKISTGYGTAIITLTEARDDNNNDLISSNNTQQSGSGGNNQFGVGVQLAYPKNPGKKIAVLRGTFRTTVARATEKIDIADVQSSPPVIKQVGDLTLTITPTAEATRGNTNLVGIRIEAVNNGGDPATLQRLHNVINRVQLSGPDGQPLYIQSSNSNGNDNNTLRYDLGFGNHRGNAPSGPLNLRLSIPTDTKDIEVPFEFKDLEMPKI
jgi:hypothetical protein